jgi:hypothetical protein
MHDMDIRTRPRRKNRVIVEPHDNYTFYLPVDTMERFRQAAEAAGRSYSALATEAINIFLAATMPIRDMHNGNGRPDDH